MGITSVGLRPPTRFGQNPSPPPYSSFLCGLRPGQPIPKEILADNAKFDAYMAAHSHQNMTWQAHLTHHADCLAVASAVGLLVGVLALLRRKQSVMPLPVAQASEVKA